MARFEDLKTSFWGDGAYWVQPALTDELVREAERVLGMILPSPLLDLLRVQNGGTVAPEWSVFPTTAAPA